MLRGLQGLDKRFIGNIMALHVGGAGIVSSIYCCHVLSSPVGLLRVWAGVFASRREPNIDTDFRASKCPDGGNRPGETLRNAGAHPSFLHCRSGGRGPAINERLGISEKRGAAMTSLRQLRRLCLPALAAAAVLLALLVAQPVAAGPGHHDKAETPGSKSAVIFNLTPNGVDKTNQFVPWLQMQNYTITQYVDTPGDDDPHSATAANFLNTSEVGVLFIDTHGGDGFFRVEQYVTEKTRDDALQAYITAGTFTAAELIATGNGPDYNISITSLGIQHKWKDNNTIVFNGACQSYSEVNDFNARDYYGYDVCVDSDVVKDDVNKVFGRMHGDTLNGTARSAKRAYDAGHSANLKYLHKATVPLQTVLSPAVENNSPANNSSFVVPTTIDAFVEFDTKMDTTVAPASVVTALDNNCGAVITDAQWQAPYKLKFKLTLNTPGSTSIDTEWVNAKAERTFKNNLDGNTGSLAPLRDHVGPNTDNFRWSVNCVAPQSECPPFTPTPAPTIPPPSCGPVGGVVQLAQGGDPPLAATQPSGGGDLYWILAIAGLPAGLAAVWYVRRRVANR